MSVDRERLPRLARAVAEARRYTVEHYGRDRDGQYVGHMPSAEYDSAVEALAEAVPALLDLLDRCETVLAEVLARDGSERYPLPSHGDDNAPGHCHDYPPHWDRTVRTCNWCTAWANAGALLAELRGEAS